MLYDNKFDVLSEEDAVFVQRLASRFHYRDGEKNEIDNSRGTIRMTAKQLNDALAFALLTGRI